MNPNIIIKETKNTFLSKRKKEKDKLEFGFTSTYIIMLSVIGFLLIYYVWILNINATKGYNIRKLERKQKELIIQQERLNVKIAELGSLSNILSNDDLENMEKIEDPNYLVIKEGVQYVYND